MYRTVHTPDYCMVFSPNKDSVGTDKPEVCCPTMPASAKHGIGYKQLVSQVEFSYSLRMVIKKVECDCVFLRPTWQRKQSLHQLTVLE